jgi:hypothetical protein
MLGAGLVAGLLPLSHAHSFAVVIALAACLMLLFPPWRGWVPFFAGAVALGLPQVLWLAAGSTTRPGMFFAWETGWDRGHHNALWFWFMNAGLFVPLSLVAFATAPPRLRRFLAPTLMLFVVPNLVRLSPAIWDNIKFLVYWCLYATVAIGLLLARLLRRGWALRGCAALAFVVLIASGALDVWRIASRQIEVPIFTADNVAFAREVLDWLPQPAVILHAYEFDSPVYLSGRRSVLGYRGHIWSQGLDEGTRKFDIDAIYAGMPDAEALLARWGVDYILVGPAERGTLFVNSGYLSRFATAGEVGDYRLLKVR